MRAASLHYVVFMLALVACTPPATRPSFQSWRQLKRDRVILQHEDASCGAAALATLMTYFYREPHNEHEVLAALRAVVGREYSAKVREGFSLLDLKRAADRLGFDAAGFDLDFEQLAKLQGAVILHLQMDGYLHFVVFRGIRGDRVALADPFLGNISLPLPRFRERWSGIAFVIQPRDESIEPSTDFWRTSNEASFASRSISPWIGSPTALPR